MDLTKILKIDSVSCLNPPPPLCAQQKQTVAEALNAMRAAHVGCVVVCDGDRMVGILTERDIVRRVLAARKPLSTRIDACMTPNPVGVRRKEPVIAAIKRMEEGGYRHLPVIDEADKLVGVLSVKRIVHYLVEHFPTTIYNLPPDPSAVQHEREGA